MVGRAQVVTVLAAALALVVAAVLGGSGRGTEPARAEAPGAPVPSRAVLPSTLAVQPESAVPRALPGGRARIFDRQFLVAYYGTAGSGVLGVLGEASPDRIIGRLRAAARPFERPLAARGIRVQPVFELIVTVVDSRPGRDRDFNHDIAVARVQEYIDAAHRHGVLLLLDLQPGRSTFSRVTRRWAWALRDPWVGLALDPEWRMAPGQIPARTIGHVGAAELNEVSAWLSGLVTAGDLPEKLFVIHQFRTDMVRGIGRVRPRPGLAMVQHVDGFGPPQAKLATYHRVARPRQFTMGFKLFLDEDRPRMSAARVLALRPRVGFVSFQ